ncbi:MAG: tripartite tricarboxylate transporter substrate binding protein [Proteobacteria bacterium]|nr:tripartite tricarboxylate transporter substrate binding protein [Pseudomonadota bacterium]
MGRTFLKVLLIACAAAAPLSQALGADAAWPQRMVRIIVPFAPGGPADALARVVGQKLSERWGQPVIVENKPGAGGNIGMAEGANAKPDGYTLVLAPGGNLTINPHYYSKMPFDVFKDFAPVTILAEAPNVLLASPKLPVKTLKDLIAYARQKPEGVTYASSGGGSTQHIAGEMLGLEGNFKTLQIPFKGSVPSVAAVIAGDVDLVFIAAATALPYVQSNKATALGIAGMTRSNVMPDVPTLHEAGLPNFEATSWYALITRSGTPPELLAKLHGDIADVIKLEKDRIVNLGFVPSGKGLKDFAAVMQRESERWKNTIVKAKIQGE